MTAAEALFWGFPNARYFDKKTLLHTGRLGKKLTELRTFGEHIYGAFVVYITQAGYPEGKFGNLTLGALNI